MDIEPYDFSDAERIRFGEYPVLDAILHRWARKIEETIFEASRMELYGGASVIEEMRFSSFYASLQHPRPIYTVSLEPFLGLGMLVLDNRFASLCLNNEVTFNEGKGLSQENHRLLQAVVQGMIKDFDQCWSGVEPVKTRLKKITTYLFRARIMSPYEPCLVGQIHLSGTEASARLTWCFPKNMFQPILEKLRSQSLIPSQYLHELPVEKLSPETILEQSQFALKVNMGDLDLKKSYALMDAGAVLPFNNDVGGQAVVEVDGVPKYVGTVGEFDGKMALRITDSYTEAKKKYKKPPQGFKPVLWPTVK